MTASQYTRMIFRESRSSRGRMIFFALCLAIGVAAVVAVAGLTRSLDEGIRREARRLLGADVTVDGRRPLPQELDDALARETVRIERTDVRETPTIVSVPARDARPGRSQLVELKVVDGRYPLYGELTLEPAMPLASLLDDQSIVVAPELLAILGLKSGDFLDVGGARFRIAGTVSDEPDKLNFSFSVGPRVLMNGAGFARTQLTGFGARVRYEALLKLPDGTTATDARALAERIRSALPDAQFYDVDEFSEAQPSLRAGLRRIGQFLGLVGLLSLLIGGVGVAQTVRSWIAHRTDSIAILRCLGLTPGEVLKLYLAQTVLLGLVGSALGVVLGTIAQWVVPMILRDLLPADLIQPFQPVAMLRGMILGVGVALVFSIPVLMAVYRVSPVRVLRKDAEALPANWVSRIGSATFVLGGIFASAWWQGGSSWYGMLFTAGLVAAVLALYGASYGVMRLVTLVPRDFGGLRLRHGLAALARPGSATRSAIVALGLGVMIVLTMNLVETRLSQQLQGDLPTDAPSTFFVDVQPAQWAGIQQILQENGAESISSYPIVTGRFVSIDDVPVEELATRVGPAEDEQRGRNRRRWVLTREQRMTYAAELPRGNRIVSGRFWDSEDARTGNGVSIEQRFAEDLGVKVGSKLVVDVQGVEIELVVTSIRFVEWRTFGINFFLLAEPGPLDRAPQLRVSTARLPNDSIMKVQDAIAAQYPNVTVVHIRDILGRVLKVLERLGLAVRVMGWFTVAAGVVILSGTISASYARRGREVALLKTLGMTRKDVVGVFVTEYALIGIVSAIIGITGAVGLSYAVINRMELDWTWHWAQLFIALVFTIALVIFVGLSVSGRPLRVRPIEVLRSE